MNRREIRRGLGNFVAITRGRLSGSTYVPHPRHAIFIETSGRCNLACRFCAYEKAPPGGFMSSETFTDVLAQVCDLGFRHVWLTPMLGEVFADPQIAARWAMLEAEPRIDGYGFFTNFIMARPGQIESLPDLRKLTMICISIYGYDAESFEKTTRKPASQFARLLDNLSRLLALTERWRPRDGLHFSVRTIKGATPMLERDTPLAELLRKFAAGGAPVSEADDYDSWGGTISQSDVDPLGIELVDGNHLYMHGACTKVFAEVQIKADGQVHACACRDVDGSLVIGHLDDAPLKDILALSNPAYRGIIEGQMKGRFASNCRSCSSYCSVYDARATRHDPAMRVLSFEQACRLLGK